MSQGIAPIPGGPGSPPDSAAPGARVQAVDIARSAALAGMVVFHAAYDLELFGYLAPGTTLTGGWAAFSSLIAGSFLFLAGVSLVLGHGAAIRWRAVWRRLAVIGGAAALVSGATLAAMPSLFIYFGILHAIALCSLVGLVFVRLPPVAPLAAALAVFALHGSNLHPLTAPFWSFTGLGATIRPTLDLIPLVPWLGPFLLGMGLARLWSPRATHPGPALARLAWPGRHSLAIYLLHQPLLIGALWLWVRLAPAS